MTTLRDLLDACDASVRSHLDAEEQVLAVGRCADITLQGDIESGGAAWTYVMVTNRRLRFVPHAELSFETSLDLDDVTLVSDRSRGHRYAIDLVHRPLSRPHCAPAHRFLIFGWGNAVATTSLTHTELAFSRRDTAAADALRGQLARRGLILEHRRRERIARRRSSIAVGSRRARRRVLRRARGGTVRRVLR